MKRKATFFIIIAFFTFASTWAQSRKDIVNNKLASKTIYEYFIAEGKEEPVIEMIEVFDEKGNTIEQKEYNSEGQLKSWQTYKYDDDNNKIEETILNSKGKVVERVEWKYENGLIVEKLYYDQKDRLTKKKEYKYEYMDN